MDTFTFADPAWLWLLLLLPLAGWLKGATGTPPAVVYSSLALVRQLQKSLYYRFSEMTVKVVTSLKTDKTPRGKDRFPAFVLNKKKEIHILTPSTKL